MSDEAFMQRAIAKAREGIAAGQLPVGAVVVRGGREIVAVYNTVWRDTDPTAHGEMNAVRQAARALGTIGLNGCTVYVTLEPCPMCFSACHWARVERVVYGAAIGDAVAAGFSELTIPAAEMVERGRSAVRVEMYAPLRDACAGLFAEWRAAGLSKPY